MATSTVCSSTSTSILTPQVQVGLQVQVLQNCTRVQCKYQVLHLWYFPSCRGLRTVYAAQQTVNFVLKVFCRLYTSKYSVLLYLKYSYKSLELQVTSKQTTKTIELLCESSVHIVMNESRCGANDDRFPLRTIPVTEKDFHQVQTQRCVSKLRCLL